MEERRDMRLQVVFKYLGMVLLFDSAFMLLSALISYFNGVDAGFTPLLLSFIFTAIIGGFPLIFVGKTDRLSSKESYAIVIGGWLASCVVGTFPYLLWGGEFSLINAWFESVSGYTTTGASILNNVEALPKGILFWRSSTHWIGGIGVVMFALVIMPMMGRSRMTVSNLEISAMAKDNYHYRSSKIMSILLGVYVGMTIANAIALRIAGMGWFDAVTHALATISTGGFSTRNASIGAFNSVSIEMITAFFMLAASLHFGIIYATIIGGKNNVFRTENSKFFIKATLIFCVVISLSLWANNSYDTLGQAIRYGVFQVITIVSTTGFATADTNIWPSLAICILVYLSIQGGMAGSTSGGLKSDRVMVAGKLIRAGITQQRHPNSIVRIKTNGTIQENNIIHFAILYIVLYGCILLAGTLINAACGLDTMTAFSASVANTGNVGPGFGEVGSMSNFSAMPILVKLVGTLQMLLGRLEIFGLLQFFLMKWWR